MGPGMTSLVLETVPIAVDLSISEDAFTVHLADGRRLAVPLAWYPRLVQGSVTERRNWKLLGEGYAIEWPDLDEHIGVEGLIAGRRSGESQQSLDRWLASRVPAAASESARAEGQTTIRIPTYRTAPLQEYSLRHRDLAATIFGYVEGAEPRCVRSERGSYSVDASTGHSGEEEGRTAAKIIIVEKGRGSRSRELQAIPEGVYILVRSTDPLGDRIWSSHIPTEFPDFFQLLKRAEMMAVRPWDHVGFSYFRFDETRHGAQNVADLLTACARP
jgi:hypothetical protein